MEVSQKKKQQTKPPGRWYLFISVATDNKQKGDRLLLHGRTAGVVHRVVPAVHAGFLGVAHLALAVPGHGVGDGLGTPVNVCHLVGPVPVTRVLVRRGLMAAVDGGLSRAASV